MGPPAMAFPALEEELACEVAVIGGGITGALIAHDLAKTGVDAVVVDRHDLGIASTAASTGLLQYEVDVPLHRLIKQVGEAHAVYAYRRGQKAIEEIQSLLSNLNADCGFVRRSTLCLASSLQDIPDLRREYECRRHFGFDVRYLEESETKELSGLQALASMLSLGDAEIDPYQFTQALLIAGKAQGARYFSQTEIASLEESTSAVTLKCTQGPTIRAKCAMLCTGYLARELLKTAPGDLNSTYVVSGLDPTGESSWPGDFLIWETARPYFYARKTSSGHIILGGGDTPGPFDHRDAELLERKAAQLLERFAEIYPGAKLDADYVWGGTFAETEDGLPFIGKVPCQDRIYAALGYGGNGITFGVIAAKLLTHLYLGRENIAESNIEEAIFRFGR
jgi:glycine/D-amino acid oxidase-like deaminating enzyme